MNHSSLRLILVDEPRFKWIQRLICQVQNSSKFVKLGFNPVILEGLKFEPKYYSELQTVLGTALNLTDQTLKSLEPRFVHQNWTQTTSSNTIRCAHITTICVIFNNVVLSSELFFFYFLETIFLNQEKRHHASTTNFGNEEMVEYTIKLMILLFLYHISKLFPHHFGTQNYFDHYGTIGVCSLLFWTCIFD